MKTKRKPSIDPDDDMVVRCPRCHGADGSYRLDHSKITVERYIVGQRYVLACRRCIASVRDAAKRPPTLQQELPL